MKTAAVILAGGMSRRMGRDKANLPFGEETMLSHLVQTYRPHFDCIAVSLNTAGRFDTYGAIEVVDRRPGEGPMAGLEAAFLHTGADIIFLTGTDLPLGDPALALYLLEQMGSHDACLIQSERGLEPLFAVYSSRCLTAIQATLDAGRRSMFHMLQQIDALILPAEGLSQFRVDRILTNVNDPQEYERILSNQ